MSYILDALRRADAERERGHVPGIHAQPTRVATPGPGGAQSAARPWLWIGLTGVLLMVLGGLIWRLQGTGGNPSADEAASKPLPLPAVTMNPTPASSPAMAPVIPPPAPAVASVARRQAPPPVAKAAAAAAPPASAGATVDSSNKIYAPEELPDDIRRDLPRLAIGGSIYSDSPTSRFVIVNGQLLHEGDTLSPGLVLQQIKLKSAVFSFRGYRYRLSF